MNKIWVKTMSVNAVWLLGEQIKGQIWTQHALKPHKMTNFPTKSVTWNFSKKLPTLGTHYKSPTRGPITRPTQTYQRN